MASAMAMVSRAERSQGNRFAGDGEAQVCEARDTAKWRSTAGSETSAVGGNCRRKTFSDTAIPDCKMPTDARRALQSKAFFRPLKRVG
jgi:hypothetical protein